MGRTARAVFTNVSPNFIVANPARNLMLGKEEARATYTGAQFAFTQSSSTAIARVPLSAVVKDLTATGEPGADPHAGDIRHAPVLFINRDTGVAISPPLTITLTDPTDKTTGTVNYDWQVNLGGASAQTFRIGILIDKYYVRYNTADDAMVTVSRPLTSGFITGGGHLVLTNPGGLKAGDLASRNDFGFAVAYKGSGASPVGHFHTMVRASGVYQIKGMGFTSLIVNGRTATFTGTAGIYNVTNGLTLVDGRAKFEVTVTDLDEPGGGDRIAITVRNSSGAVWFSSNWTTATNGQSLANGTITVK
jgi:hypothetical protein